MAEVPARQRAQSAEARVVKHRFHQVDVFATEPLTGNPLAVVHDAQGLSDATMAAFARWTNLSETTFLLPPADARADYRVRIFTPFAELPFAGHPTLGSCWSWLAAGGKPRDADTVVQECGVGLVRLRRGGERLAFAAPPTRRSGPLDATTLGKIVAALHLSEADVLAHQWVDNGPGWAAVQLESAARVLALGIDWDVLDAIKLGVVGAHPAGYDTAFELRAFVGGGRFEDPVTGSLNASVAQWLIRTGAAPSQYVASQGAALGRAGRIYVEQLKDDIWIGGDVVLCVEGHVDLP